MLDHAMPATTAPAGAPRSDTPNDPAARDWIALLNPYRRPDLSRGIFELVVTIVPLCAMWFLTYLALQVSVVLALVLAVPAGGLLVRLFLIQHDCGHGAFFRKKTTNDWVGRILGVFTVTPYDVWRRSHAVHHATSGNLDHRGTGDIHTLTVDEYHAMSWFEQLKYRLYRHPFVMFGLGPAYVFLLQNRLPFGYMTAGSIYWLSAMLTNLGIVVLSAALILLVGWQSFLMVHLPIVLIAATIGIWLFYIQHQFEDAHWEPDPSWNVHEAALHGSSHYDLPAVLRWFTANIGIHHIHHLCARIPYYRLNEVLKAYPELADVHRITLWESFQYVGLQLWDPQQKRMVSFREARASVA
ncbi:MAG: fatty acid desaturase [Pseudomonadota bacterium]